MKGWQAGVGAGAARGRPQRQAFTLLETILALMVFSIAVVALVGAINNMGTASLEARRTREVQAHLETMMLELTRQPPQEILAQQPSFESDSRSDDVDYHVQMTAADLSNADGQPLKGLYALKVTARWREGAGRQEMSADSMVYPPLFYAPR